MAEPLASHARFRTRRADEAQSEAARVLSVHELRLRRDAPLDARLNAAGHGPVVLCWMDYAAAVEVRAPELGDYVAVNVPVAGSMRVGHRGREFVADARTAAVFSPAGDLRMQYGADLRQFIVRVDAAALLEHLVALAPQARTDTLRFAPTMDLTGPAAAFGGSVRLLQDLLERQPQRVPPAAGARVVEMLLTALLLGQPGSHSDALTAEPAPVTARTVRRAREFIDARPEDVATVREIADAAGVGIRSLQEAFRLQLGESPTAYAQRVRLARAHAALRAADPGDGTTVTEIALRFGFAHTGRFAAAYARRYGQPPSATLRS
jgi:AraC-like DNA-binding protein